MAAGVLTLVAGVLLATPTNKRSALNWPVTVPPPEEVLVIAPGAQVRVRVAVGETLPALGLRQSIQGFGLPGNHLKVRTDPLVPAATWKYSGLAKGYYTELENILEVTVRSGVRAKLQLQLGAGGRVVLVGAAAELPVEADVPIVREAESPAGSGAADA
jgi:hypothetical protein